MSEKKIKLSNGMEIPLMGLGTHKMENPIEVVYESIKNGARLIDTGTRYGNEEFVGAGVKKALEDGIVKRDELTIVGKVWLQGRKNPEEPLDYTLKCFGIDDIDLYLDHWPYGKDYRDQNQISDPFKPVPIYDFWPKMEELVEKKKIKALGVSNYNVQCLSNLLSFCNIRPVVNEVEFNPFYYQKNLKEFCDKENIKIIAYTPLVSGIVARHYNEDHNNEFNPFKEEIIKEYATKYSKTEGQIILNWLHTIGVIPIPATSKTWRMKENLSALEFKMEKEDFEKMSTYFLNGRKRKFVVGNKYFGVNILG